MRKPAGFLLISILLPGLLAGCNDSPGKLQMTLSTSTLQLYPDNITQQPIVVNASVSGHSREPVSVTISGVPSGVEVSANSLSLSENAPGAFVLKATTTAGSDQFSAGSAQVTYPLVVQATAGAQQTSANVTLTISAQNAGFVPEKTDLPVMNITTDGAAPIVSEDDYITGSVTITPVAGSTDAPYSGTMKIKGHGNTTWALPKKPYKFKLDTKSALLGMGSNKTWDLLANYDDKSLLRDQVAFEVGRRVGLAWTPNTRFVELFLNGQYEGNYQLTESIVIDKNRVNIPEMDDTDNSGAALTGGYLLEVDNRGDPDDILFRTSRGTLMDLHDPDPATPQQLAYIEDYFEQTENALYSTNFTDPSTGYQQFLDQDSFINWYLVNELFKNNDAVFWSSCWMYKDRSDKLFMGPAWDFDIGAGNINYNGNDDPTGWWVRSNPLTYTQWYKRLFDDPAFTQAVANRWKELKTSQFDTLSTYIDQNAAALNQSQANNFQRWPILGVYVIPNAEVAGSYQGEIDYLKSWLTKRIAWMDSQLEPEASSSVSGNKPGR